MKRCFSRLFNELSIGAIRRVESILIELSDFGMANAHHVRSGHRSAPPSSGAPGHLRSQRGAAPQGRSFS